VVAEIAFSLCGDIYGVQMDGITTFLKSIRLNLTASGPAAVLIVLIICVAALGIFSGQADRSISFMYVVLGFVLVSGDRGT
jgi:hypothetical protein